MPLGQTPGWKPPNKGGNQTPGRGPSTPIPNRGPSTPVPDRGPPGVPTPGAPAWRTVAGRPTANRTFMMKSAVHAQASRVDPSMASAMQKLNITNTQPQKPPAPPSDCIDPSMGPPPAEEAGDAWQGSACPTIDSALSTPNVAVINKTCTCTTRTIDDFKLGQIIALPHHVPNMNPKNKANHPRLAFTCEGPVFSKRRLAAVLLKHQNTLFCLPLYSFEGRGLGCKSDKLKWEYVPVMNKGDTKFKNVGKWQACEVETYDAKKPMKASSCIQVTGGMKVDPGEHISFVGRMDCASYGRLMQAYERRVEIAKQRAYEPDGPRPKV